MATEPTSSLMDALRAQLVRLIDFYEEDRKVDARFVRAQLKPLLAALLLRDLPHDENPLRELLSWAIANLSVYVRQRPQSAGFVEKFKLAEAAIGEGTDLLRDLPPATIAPRQDVLPWLDQAVMDWKSETFRPSHHYIMLFEGAAAEIRRLRADLPPAQTPLCKDDEHLFGPCKTGGMPYLASRLMPPTADDIAWAQQEIADLSPAETKTEPRP